MFGSKVLCSIAGGLSAAVAYKTFISQKSYGVVHAASPTSSLLEKIQADVDRIKGNVQGYSSGIQQSVEKYKNEIASEVKKTLAKDITLYWGSGSPPCWKVMIALEEKGLGQYNSKLMSFAKKDHKSPEIMKLNPRGQFPTMVHSVSDAEVVLGESLAVLLYLESTFYGLGTQLIPDEPAKKALVLQRMVETQNLQKKAVEDVIFPLLSWDKMKLLAEKESMKQNKLALVDELNLWESYLVKSGGQYLCGQDFTLVDAAMFPVLAFLVRLGLKLSPRFPKLAKYYDAMMSRPSVKASYPPHWREGPGPNALNDLY